MAGRGIPDKQPFDGCEWDCTLHNGANGCLRRKLDPELRDDFCVGRHVCEIEWEDAGKCKSCYRRDRRNIVECVYGGNW